MSDSADKPKRKSVAFSEGTTIVDGNGQVTEMANGAGGDKETAQSHSDPNGDAAVDEVTDMFKDLAKKKKKKSSTKKEGDEEGADDEKPAADDDEIDLSALKKKKKKKSKPVGEDEAEAKSKEAGEGADEPAPQAEEDDNLFNEDEMRGGLGIWSHDSESPLPYNQLLGRFFAQLHDRHPDLAGGAAKSYKIPPPQCLREGNKKTIFANLPEISKRLKRSDDHIIQFLFAEMGTSGSVDGSRRLVIKGRFQSKQIENILRRYIVEYVTCKTCKSPDTDLSKGENRLSFVTCNSCGSRRSVTAIKTGFSAQIGKRKRMQA